MAKSILDPRLNGGQQMALKCKPSEKSKPALYKIENIKNGKLYIGSTKHLGRRWAGHKGKLRHGKHGNPGLQSDYLKYGESVFVMSVLESSDSEFSRHQEAKCIEKFEIEVGEGQLYNKNLLIAERFLVTIDGQTKTVEAWAKDLKLNRIKVYNRLKAGKTPEQALSLSHSLCSLTNEQAKEIREAYERGVSVKELCAKYEVSQSPIARIIRGDSYKDAGGPINKRTRMNKAQVLKIRQAYKKGKALSTIGQELNLHENSILSIVSGKSYKHFGGPIATAPFRYRPNHRQKTA